MSLKITKNNFEQEVIQSDLPVLLDFWAPWCGPCRMVGPIVDELSTELEGKAKIGKINVDEEHELAASFKVMSIPTLAVIKNGKVIALEVGARDKAGLKQMLEV